jgi:hypothetical protein
MSESFLKLFVRLPIFLAMWLLFIAIKLPTAILGLVVVPLIYPYRATDYADLPFWTRPWANPEDHQGGPKSVPGASLPKWWVEENGAGLGSWWRYNAIRNPANGLRSFEFFDIWTLTQGKFVTGHRLTSSAMSLGTSARAMVQKPTATGRGRAYSPAAN